MLLFVHYPCRSSIHLLPSCPYIPTQTHTQACRNINYERLDAFLCTACGFSAYATFNWRFTAKLAAPGALLAVGAAGDNRELEAQDRAEALSAYQRALGNVRDEQATLRSATLPTIARHWRAFAAVEGAGGDEEEEVDDGLGHGSLRGLLAAGEAQEGGVGVMSQLGFSYVRVRVWFVCSEGWHDACMLIQRCHGCLYKAYEHTTQSVRATLNGSGSVRMGGYDAEVLAFLENDDEKEEDEEEEQQAGARGGEDGEEEEVVMEEAGSPRKYDV